MVITMKRSRISIIGAGGHGRVIADIARLNGYETVMFFDDGDVPGIAGKVTDSLAHVEDADFFVAIGNCEVRKRISAELTLKGANIVSLVHPRATVASDVSIGDGVAVMAGAVINPGAVIGDGAIINTSSSVDHDCRVGQYTHVSVGAHVAGTVNIGERVFVCAGATVINNVNICDGAVIAAGAVVIKDITEPGTYKGVPARR